MLTFIIFAVVVIIGLLVILVATRPADFRVSRSTTISAPPPTVFAQVNDFHNWEAWSPWAKLDPNSTTTYEGAPAGKGAIFRWAGNKKVGAGNMTILDSHPTNLVRIKLEFLKPFKATNTAEFTFKPQGSQTLVEWSMFGKNNFFFKAFSLFVDCDKMIGKDFENGLAQMKSIAESSPT